MEPLKSPSEAISDDKVVQVPHPVEINASGNANVTIKNSNFGSGTLVVNKFGCKEGTLQPENIIHCSEKLAGFLKAKAEELLQNEKKHSLLAEQDSASSCSSKEEVMASTDKTGHYYLRRYVHSSHQRPPTGNIECKQLFSDASSQAKLEAGKCCATVPEKELYELMHGNIVWMVGQAGVGKSTLTKCILDKIVNEKLYDVDFIFYLDCQAIDFNRKSDVLEFLANDSSVHETYSDCSVELKEVLEMLDKSDKVGVILDGVDEGKMTNQLSQSFETSAFGSSWLCNDTGRPNTSSIHDIANANTFIYNLINGNILSRAKKLVFSRVQQFQSLHDMYMPKFIVEVLGLNESGQQAVCSDVCREEHAKVTKVWQYLNDHPELKSYCLMPVSCIQVMCCIYLSFDDNAININSITNIYVSTLSLVIQNSQLINREVKELCALAYSEFDPDISLDQEDLKKEKLGSKSASLFSTTSMLFWKESESMSSCFFHPNSQEFLIALHLVLFSDLGTFDNYMQMLFDDLSELLLEFQSREIADKVKSLKIVPKFLFGLFNSTTLKYLQKLLQKGSMNEDDLDQKKMLLTQRFFKVVKHPTFEHFTTTCTWLYEMRDDQLTADVIAVLKGEKALHRSEGNNGSSFAISESVPSYEFVIETGEVLPCDNPAVHYVLRACQYKTSLKLKIFLAYEEAAKDFLSEMKVTLQLSDIKINQLHLNFSITSLDTCTALRDCLHKTERLVLWKDETFPTTELWIIQELLNGIGKLEKQLPSLYWNWPLDDEGLAAFSSSLQNVECLVIKVECRRGVHVTQQGLKDFTNAILNLFPPLADFKLINESLINRPIMDFFKDCHFKHSQFSFYPFLIPNF